MFSAVVRLSHNSVDPCIPAALISEDFLSFFSGKIIRIREEINQVQRPTAVDVSLASLMILFFFFWCVKIKTLWFQHAIIYLMEMKPSRNDISVVSIKYTLGSTGCRSSFTSSNFKFFPSWSLVSQVFIFFCFSTALFRSHSISVEFTFGPWLSRSRTLILLSFSHPDGDLLKLPQIFVAWPDVIQAFAAARVASGWTLVNRRVPAALGF